MKIKLSNLTEVLTFQLKGLYNAETKLEKALPNYGSQVSSSALKKEMEHYAESTTNKILKLERVFNYLMNEPGGVNNEVIDKLLNYLDEMFGTASTPHIRDAVFAGCVQSINHYKIGGFGTALAFATELKLNDVSELLYEILAWEKATDHALTMIALGELNAKAVEEPEHHDNGQL